MTATLLPQPRWRDAARALVSGCVDLRSDDEAVTLMQAVCVGLGDELYPAFLRVLCEIGVHGDYAARAAVARTLVRALRSGRLPSGRRAAWGSNLRAGGGGRSLGPLEYLCACAADREHAAALSARDFDLGAQSVMALVAADDDARLLYAAHLRACAEDPLEGALPRSGRHAMRALAQAWLDGAEPAQASAAFLAALPEHPSAPAVASSPAWPAVNPAYLKR